MNDAIVLLVIFAWSVMMYIIGLENGEAKAINRDAHSREDIKHFDKAHFTAVTAQGRKFVYCPVGNICSWSEGDYDNKWCHYEKKYFSEIGA